MEQQEDTEGPKPVGPEAGPGAWLAAAREQAGLSLMQAAEQLHLDVAAVKALEAGRFEVLGAAVYARGHLRRYAEVVGLPPQEVEKLFLQLHPARSTPDLRHGAGMQKSDAASRALRPGTAALGALVLVIIGVVLWARRVPHTPAVPSRPVASAAVSSAPVRDAAAPNSAVANSAVADPAATAGAPVPIDNTLTPLWAPTLDSAAQRSPMDGGGGATDGSPSHASNQHAAAKAPPARAHGTHP
jgi:cytoskeleton protein RodZ